MEIVNLKMENNSIEFILRGEGHTFCSLLVRMLQRMDNVTFAPYHIDHPLVGAPKIYVKVKDGSSISETLKKAAQNIINIMTSLKEQVEENL